MRIASNIRQATHRDILPIENVRFPLSAHTTFRLEEAPDWKDNIHNLTFVLDDVEIIKVMLTNLQLTADFLNLVGMICSVSLASFCGIATDI